MSKQGHADTSEPEEERHSKYIVVHVHSFVLSSPGRATCQSCGWVERVKQEEAEEQAP